MAFIFADLIVLPIIVAYRKYYGTEFALRITAHPFWEEIVQVTRSAAARWRSPRAPDGPA